MIVIVTPHDLHVDGVISLIHGAGAYGKTEAPARSLA